MAMIDYGAILKVDGEFINKNKGMFMEVSDTGYEPLEKATYPDYGEVNIAGNYFVYAGDKDFLMCFYKTMLTIVSNGKVIVGNWGFGTPFKEETFFINNFPSIKIANLDKQKHTDNTTCFDNYDRGLINDDRKHNRKRNLIGWQRYAKRYCRRKKDPQYSWYSRRYLATWDYKGHHYECIYGYGIDSSEDCWNEIKHTAYDFSDTERHIIDSWFRGE